MVVGWGLFDGLRGAVAPTPTLIRLTRHTPLMKNSITPYVTLFLAILLVAPSASGQGQGDREVNLLDLYPAGDDYFFEVAALPGPSTNRTRALVLFSLTHNLMTFRTDGRGADRRYRSTPQVFVEAIDKEGVVAAFGRWVDTVLVTEYKSTLSKRERAQGFLEMDLRPGIYIFRYRIESGEKARAFSRDSDPMEIPDLGGERVGFGTPLFLDEIRDVPTPDGDRIRLTPLGLDGNAAFGHPFQLLLSATAPDEMFGLDYRVLSLDREGSPIEIAISGTARKVGGRGTIPGEVEIAESGRIEIGTREESGRESLTALIDVKGGKLRPGPYMLILSLGNESGTRSDTTLFRVSWVDRPLSLGDPTYAIRALRPIATDEEISALLRGDDAERAERLMEYWSHTDPTPATDYNERMVAYYRRVDYAYFNFATFGTTDGSKSDRGKIYVLYGPPTNVERRLDPEDGPREVWMYENEVRRTFVFLDRTEGGEYRLVEYYDL